MPIARISLLKGKSPAFIRALSESVQRALVEAFDVPADDHFQMIHQHEPGELIFDRHYLGGPRSDDFVLIAITCGLNSPSGQPRDTAMKGAFYRHLAGLLAEAPGIRPEDVMVVITSNERNDWSFAGGVVSMIGTAP